MALSLPINHHLLALVLIFVVFSSTLGIANEYPRLAGYEYPPLGAAGVVANEYLPQAEVDGASDQFLPQAGIIGTNAPLLFNKALECITDKSIYRRCEEEHRLSESGDLHVPPEYADEYCNGPCLAETNHVLDCIEEIFRGFIFLNTATLQNIRDTLESGCSYGPKRGNFDVLEHLQADNAGKNQASWAVIYVMAAMIAAWRLLF